MTTVVLNASAIPGTIVLPFTGTIAVPGNGRVTVDIRDVPVCLGMGMLYVSSRSRSQTLSGAPRAGSAGRIVASTALANGTLSIANQPDIPRVAAVRVDSGTSAITAGALAVDYYTNTGARYTDTISLVAPASSLTTTNTTYGMVALNSVIITALAGGTSPKVQINDTNAFAIQVNPAFADFSVIRAFVDGVAEGVGTVSSTAAAITPSTTPNATHTYSFVASFTS